MVLSLFRFCHFFIFRHAVTWFSIGPIGESCTSCRLTPGVTPLTVHLSWTHPSTDGDARSVEAAIGGMEPEIGEGKAQKLREQGSLYGISNEAYVYTGMFLQEMGGR